MKYLTSEEITKAKKNISEIKPYKTTKEIIFSNIFTFFNKLYIIFLKSQAKSYTNYFL